MLQTNSNGVINSKSKYILPAPCYALHRLQAASQAFAGPPVLQNSSVTYCVVQAVYHRWKTGKDSRDGMASAEAAQKGGWEDSGCPERQLGGLAEAGWQRWGCGQPA